MVRAKLRVAEIRKKFGQSTEEVILNPIYDTSTPENARFTKATPWGECRLAIDNPAALEQFTLGKIFVVDFKSEEEASDVSS